MNTTKKRNRSAARKARRIATSQRPPSVAPPGWMHGHASSPYYERQRRHGTRIMAREHDDR